MTTARHTDKSKDDLRHVLLTYAAAKAGCTVSVIVGVLCIYAYEAAARLRRYSYLLRTLLKVLLLS